MCDHNVPLSDDQEENLKHYFSAPKPSPEFKEKLGAELYVYHIKALHSNQNKGVLMENIFEPIQSWLYPLRLFSLRTFGIVLAGLLLISGTVYALGMSTGYIPGFGMIPSNDQIRTISSPISQTRDGVTITVKRILITSDRTSVSIAVTGLAQDAIADDRYSIEEQKKQCSTPPKIKIGAQEYLGSTSGKIGEYDQDNQYIETYYYNSISNEVSNANLVIPCIIHTRPGKAPENWSIPVTFVPAPTNIAVLPVIHVITTPLAENAKANPSSATPMVLENVIETPDGYIFKGSFSPLFEGSITRRVTNSDLSITDANGAAIYWKSVEELTSPTGDDGVLHWAYQVNEKNIAWPISIRINSVDVDCSTETVSFQFDAGVNPQPGDSWKDVHNIQSGKCNISISSIKRTSEGYIFEIDKPTPASLTNISIETIGAFKNTNFRNSQNIEYELIYLHKIPSGIIQVTVSDISESISGNWTVRWQPK